MRLSFMETDGPPGSGGAQTWLVSKSRADVSAVNHLDADRGCFADNVDPFEVKVGRRPASLMEACLFCRFLSDKDRRPRAGCISVKSLSMLAFTRRPVLTC